MSTVMEMRVETETFGAPTEVAPADRDLEDEAARAERRPAWYAAIVVLDALAILAFVTWVVIPRLT
jgi:hypothetical protein